MPRHAIGAISLNCSPKLRLGLALTSCLFIFGCSSGDGELVGFGKYKIGKTTPGDSYVMGRCDPKGSNTFCFMNRSPSIAGHKTQTDLYFRGHGDDAPLIEISVGVWNCQVGPVGTDLQKKLGEPTKVADTRAIWALKKMTVIALLPKDNELCMVHFLDPSDTKRIDSLFPGPVANAPEDEPTSGPAPASADAPAADALKATAGAPAAPASDAPKAVPAAATAP